MLKCSAFSAAMVAVFAACASSQPTSPPPAAEPTPVNLPPAPVEATSSSGEQSEQADAGEVKPDTSVTRDAGTGISDMDASTDAGSATAMSSCKTDADCVPAQCCHPTSCALKSAAPDCSKTMCTKECRGGTMDCGGGCLCQQGKCNAKLGRP
jgi:hypothetical protein